MPIARTMNGAKNFLEPNKVYTIKVPTHRGWLMIPARYVGPLSKLQEFGDYADFWEPVNPSDPQLVEWFNLRYDWWGEEPKGDPYRECFDKKQFVCTGEMLILIDEKILFW